jgi:hypothetical protein
MPFGNQLKYPKLPLGKYEALSLLPTKEHLKESGGYPICEVRSVPLNRLHSFDDVLDVCIGF